MKRRYVVLVMTLFFLAGSLLPAIALITDTQGDNVGPLDLTSANAEVYDRGDVTLLKISIASAPHLPGVVMFECDVDDSTGTGGNLGTLGQPVPPCPCKTAAGIDIVITLFTRPQGNGASSSSCAACSDGEGDCAQGRKVGQWFATTALSGQPARNVGVLSGYLHPLPFSPTQAKTRDCYTLPWSHIIAYAHQHLQETGDPGIFNYAKARDNGYGTGRWQVSIWHDEAYADRDDISDNYPPGDYLNISDWGPNGDGVMADTYASSGPTDITFCEGNLDHDQDVDGSDAATFKANFGRSIYKYTCPSCGPNY